MVHTHDPADEQDGIVDLSKYAWLSLGVGILVLALKLGAWWITDSVGLFSDAMESLVNIAAAIVAIIALRTAAKPADRDHQFGHGKAEYFSALSEGVLIILAASLIIFAAIPRLLNPQPLEEIGLGLGISVLASLLNAAVAVILWRAGTRHGSLALIADSKHLLTDLWTTGGVLVAVVIVGLSGWLILDPLIALAVAVNIIWVGLGLMRRSMSGLMDSALPESDVAKLRAALAPYRGQEIEIHAVQSRISGRQRFVSLHVLVPGDWSVTAGHDLCESIEGSVKQALTTCSVHTHLEPREDPRAFSDTPVGAEHELD
ncbi:cation diffusion facilitator family transporter [Candidatus Nanopelagicales bacterium]|nr:cation diffusion facilitator family transporter [Candidatus Nanopelagicales bacterium]